MPAIGKFDDLQKLLERRSRHSRTGPQRRGPGEPWLWHSTVRPPWMRKRDKRARNKVARRTRKRNQQR